MIAHVGDGARLGELGLLPAVLEVPVEQVGLVHAAAQPGFGLDPGRDLPHVALIRGDTPREQGVLLGQLLEQRLGVERDGPAAQIADPFPQVLHALVLFGVALQLGPQLALGGRELRKNLLEVGRRLDGQG